MRGMIVYLGLALAGALFLLGIKELKINRKRKRGLFISTVLMALYLLGSRYAEAAEPAESICESTLSQKDQMQIAELVKTKEWQNFKAFWKKLDAIEPKKGNIEGYKIKSRDEGKYPGAISSEQREKLLKELKVLTDSLAQVGGKIIGQAEVNWLITCQSSSTFPMEEGWLEGICYSRIRYMESASITRMIPPPTLILKEISLRDLEARIDALLLLQKNGKVTQEEYKQALGNIQEEIRRHSIFSIFYALGWNGVPHLAGPEHIIQDYIESLKKDHAEYEAGRKKQNIVQSSGAAEEDRYRELDEAHDKAMRELERLKTRIPLMDKLIADLERQ